MKQFTWTPQEEEFVRKNLNKLTIPQMAEKLSRTEVAVKLYMHRHRIAQGKVGKRSLIQNLLQIKFRDASYFMPNRSFYNTVEISQRRFWRIYHGLETPTEEEYQRIARHLEITPQEAFECRQLKLFEDLAQ